MLARMRVPDTCPSKITCCTSQSLSLSGQLACLKLNAWELVVRKLLPVHSLFDLWLHPSTSSVLVCQNKVVFVASAMGCYPPIFRACL